MGDGQERTEVATQKHRVDARKKGTVVKSTDLVNAAGIVAFLLVLPMAGASIGTGAIASVHNSFTSIPTDLNLSHLLGFGTNALRPVLPGMVMVFATAITVGLVMNFAQVGFVLSGQALIPNFARLNPLSGLKKFFSRNSLFDSLKAVGKTALFGLIAYISIKGSWAELNGLNQVPPAEALSVVGAVLRTMGIRVAIAWAALAGGDYYFQRQQVENQLKMTKDEVKREMREMETSPELKSARNIRRRRLMRQRLRDAVRSADVIVTNPTHYAVAIKYEAGKSYAPIVVAKGVDYLAAKIREEAAEAEIPLIPNPPLARALYKQCEVGDFVPRELFHAVAEVLAHVYKTLKKIPKVG